VRLSTPLRRLVPARTPEGFHVLSLGTAAYRDGAEERVAEILAAAHDLGSLSDELALAARDWAQIYHLSSSRANVLRALRLPARAHVLEVGAGCGAITRYLGETCAAVDAVEPMEARARAACLRTRDLANVEVFVGTLDDLPNEAGYDLVVVIGVLEYAGAGAPDQAPYQRFVDRLAAQVRPGGTVVLAIENRIGVKYLAGAPEDHSGRPWDSVESYPGPSPARTFSRSELGAMLTTAGLSPQFLGAFPDYKITRCVFADELFARAPALAWLIPRFPSPDWVGRRARAASEADLWATLVSAGLGAHFVNSFVVVAAKDHPGLHLWPDRQLAVFYQPERRAPYATETRLIRRGPTLTFRRTKLASGPPRPPGSLEHVVSDSTFHAGGDLIELLARADDTTLARFLTSWVSLVEAQPAGSNIDLVPHNLIVGSRGRLLPFDTEWADPTYTHRDVIARGVLETSRRLAERTPRGRWPCETVGDLARHLGALAGLDADGSWIDALVERESALQAEAALTVADGDLSPQEVIARAIRDGLARPLSDMPLGERDHERVAAREAAIAALRGDHDRVAAALEAAVADLSGAHERATALEAMISNLRGAVEQSEARTAEAEARTAAAETRTATIEGSRSWRLTAPLRGARRTVTSILHRPAT
jgi:SAM-dependent methyltransferase